MDEKRRAEDNYPPSGKAKRKVQLLTPFEGQAPGVLCHLHALECVHGNGTANL